MSSLPAVRKQAPVPVEAPEGFMMPPPKPQVASGVRLGLTTLVIAGLGLAIWSAVAPISSAAVAPGVIAVDTARKVVQHVEGGAVAELLVRDGDHVASGQVLVRLDDLESKAQHDVLEGRWIAQMAQHARLLSEREGRDAMPWPARLEPYRERKDVLEIISGQERIFTTLRDSLRGQTEVLQARISAFGAQSAALAAQLVAVGDQLRLVEEELVVVRSMVAKGLAQKPRQLALERTAAGLFGQRGDLQHRMAQITEQVTGTQIEIINLVRTRAERASIELRDLEPQLAEVDRKLAEARVKLARRDVVAPQSGIVLDLRYHTLGGVVPAGGKILDLVPAEDRLIVEARVKPADIDVVHSGMIAQVSLSAFKGRTTPQLPGRVLHVSADALPSDRANPGQSSPGQSYYLARIELDHVPLATAQGIRLVPGMPAEVFIETGQRTLAAYLLQPLTDSFRRAFRED